MKRLIIKPFDLIKEWETKEIVDIEFTVSLVTVFFGRYDNESPPFYNYLFKDNYKKIIWEVILKIFKVNLTNQNKADFTKAISHHWHAGIYRYYLHQENLFFPKDP